MIDLHSSQTMSATSRGFLSLAGLTSKINVVDALATNARLGLPRRLCSFTGIKGTIRTFRLRCMTA
jgi:hypothetical protein